MKKKLLLAKISVMRSFHTPGCNNYIKRAKNAIYITPMNSWEHEFEKFKICYWLKLQGYDFITEAVENKTGFRRDIVCLDTGEIFEIETNKKRAERFKGQNVSVVKLWERDNQKSMEKQNLGEAKVKNP